MKTAIIISAYNGFNKILPYGIKSWEQYAKKFGIGLIVPNMKIDNKPGCNEWESGVWAKWDALRSVIDEYDKFLLVDSDTMVRWDLPNIFELTNDIKFACIVDTDRYSGKHHFPQWKDYVDVSKMEYEKYFNAGVVLFDKGIGNIILDNLDDFFNFYSKRVENNIRIDAVEQTAINIIAQQHFNSKIGYLDFRFNNMVMCNYNNYDFVNDSYIWHFTGPKMGGWGNKANIMENTWKLVKDYY